MTQSPLPPAGHLPPSHHWTLWARQRPDHWSYQRTDCRAWLLVRAVEIKALCPDVELLILRPGERPLMPRATAHRRIG